MEKREMTPQEQAAYNLGATRWGLGAALVMAALGWVVAIEGDGRRADRFADCPSGAGSLPGLGTAQAAEGEPVNLFVLSDPGAACVWSDRAVAWKRDESFATRLTVWCVEEREDVEGDEIVAWTQTEGQPRATRTVVQRDFYWWTVIEDDSDLKPLVDACEGGGFLGWAKGGSRNEGGTIRRGEEDRTRITGFYGGLVWCVGDDLYALTDGKPNDGNPYDRRFDIGKDVGSMREH